MLWQALEAMDELAQIGPLFVVLMECYREDGARTTAQELDLMLEKVPEHNVVLARSSYNAMRVEG